MKSIDILKFIEEQGGITTAARLKKAGFTPGSIDYAYKCGDIDKPSRGVYCCFDSLDDDFATVCLRWKRCILSHGSSLYLLGLSDRVPSALDVTVPHGYNPKSLKEENPGIRIHRVSPSLHGLGLIEVKTPMGNTTRCYDAERSVADLIKQRSKGGVDAQLIRDAVGGYFRMEGRDLARLSQMCEALGVRDELQTYLEVLT